MAAQGDAPTVGLSPSDSAEDESELDQTEKLALSDSDTEERVSKSGGTDAAEFNEYGKESSPGKFQLDSDDYPSPDKVRKSASTAKKRVNQLVDSDSDTVSDRANGTGATVKAIPTRVSNLIDADDSEDDVLPSQLAVSESEDGGTSEAARKRVQPLVDSESDVEPYQQRSSSDGDGATQKVETKKVKKLKKKKSSQTKSPGHLEGGGEFQNKLAGLCDESSEDEDYMAPKGSDDEGDPAPKVPSERPPKRMTAKEAEEQMKIIQSESQRMAREASLSVPYHRPKQHSLKEFLNRHNVMRPIAQMDAPKAAAAIKMTKEQLEEYAKNLDERAKESQQFFKSESEEDDEADDEVAESKVTEPGEACTSVVDQATAVTPDSDMTSAQPIEPEGSTALPVAEASNPSKESQIDAIEPQPDTLATPQPDTLATHQPVVIDYNFEERPAEKRVSKLDRLKERVRAQMTPNSSPSLKGTSDTIIDLDTGDVLPGINAGRDELFQRFLKHKEQGPKKKTQHLSLLSTENGVFKEENLVMQVEESDEVIQDSKPRSAFFKLKEALGTKLAQKRRDEIMRRKADAEVMQKKNKVNDEEMEDEVHELDDDEEESGNEKDDNSEEPTVLDVDEDEELIIEPQSEEEENVDDDEEDHDESKDNELDNADETAQKERRRIVVMSDSDDEDAQSHARNEESAPITATQIQKTSREVDDLLDICSDSKQPVVPELTTPVAVDAVLYTQNTNEDDVSESQLGDMCSGAFFTQAPLPAESGEADADGIVDEFESEPQLGTHTFESSDEEDAPNGPKIKKSSKRAVVPLSDDEEEPTPKEPVEAEDEEEAEDEVADDAEVVIDYDSEENEIEVVQTKMDRKKKAREYFEKEAELSESEWGSEDEDEQNMDQFDAEAGDADVFDEDKMHSELERIHMRRMRDADAREVKKIKDMLIEDEEDTGAGRERQFRWKNVNDSNWDDAPAADGETELRESDDENEEAWRKMRYERELLLKDTERSVTANDSLNAAQNASTSVASPLRLSSTMNATTRRRITIVKSATNTPPVNSKVDSSFLIHKAGGAMQMTRNSFLGRDEQTLARLAALSKPEVEGGALSVVSKGGGNFVFSTLSPSVVEKAAKRKSDPTEDTAQAAKKPKSGGPSTTTLSKGLMKKRLLDSLT